MSEKKQHVFHNKQCIISKSFSESLAFGDPRTDVARSAMRGSAVIEIAFFPRITANNCAACCLIHLGIRRRLSMCSVPRASRKFFSVATAHSSAAAR
jgi:hypothetical protein